MALWPSVPGYTLVRRIARGSSGEVFEAQAPGGFSKAIKIVPIDHRNPLSSRELDGVGLIRSIRHPYLIAIDRVDVSDDQVTIVMELADGSLNDEFKAARAHGLPGIPRQRLLLWLYEAAEVLDFLNFRHNVRHLDVKPDNLFFVGGHLKVGDFGLLREAERHHINANSNAATPTFAPPELYEGRTFASSDQYSLAVVYATMLCGKPPYSGGSHNELYHRQASGKPNLAGIYECDRDALKRALHATPAQRFPSCTDFVRALCEYGGSYPNDEAVYPGPSGGARGEGDLRPSSHPSRQNILDSRPGSAANRPTASIATLFVPGRAPSASHTMHWTIDGDARTALEKLRETGAMRGAPVLEPTPLTLVFYLQGGPRGWRPLLGVRDPFLLIVRLLPRGEQAGGLHIVTTLEHHGSALPTGVFEQHAKAMFEDLFRDAGVRRAAAVPVRGEPRALYNGLMELVPRGGALRNIPFSCMGIDASASGLGVFSMAPLESGLVQVKLETGDLVAAKIVRCRPRHDVNGYELGLSLISGHMPPAIVRPES